MSDALTARIEETLKADDVILFMKGTPTFPQCGFSAAVVDVITHTGTPFKSYDILQDPDIRDGLKTYSDWPTFPQLYVKGELVGGCDIIREMHSTGELQSLFDESGVTPAKET
jgi:monothiol glutaredoxin